MKAPVHLSGILVGVVAAIAIAGLAGKAFHLPLLQSWGSHSVGMKDTTAWLIIEHAWAGFVISRPDRRGQTLPVYFIAGTTLLIAYGLTREISHLENLQSYNPQKSWFPSIVTIVSATLLAFKAFLSLLLSTPWPARVTSWLVSAIGACAVAGYAANVPSLYYFIPGYTTAMAINTALCLVLLGLVAVPIRHA